MEYKVLTQEDRRWSGKFSPENLEQTLNSYAAEGWRVVSTFPVGSPWSRSSLQVRMRRERGTPAGRPAPRSRRRPVGVRGPPTLPPSFSATRLAAKFAAIAVVVVLAGCGGSGGIDASYSAERPAHVLKAP